MDVLIKVSARHIHLNKEVYDKLFDNELTIRNNLNQIGQFAANETVDIYNDNYKFSNVRIVGPLRGYNQIEISKSDARLLKIEPPVRTSGDLSGASSLIIETKKGKIELPCVIIADRHIHIPTEMAKKLNIINGETLKLEVFGEKHGIIDIHAKVSDDAAFEVHLDTDDANAFLITDGMMGKLYK